MSVQRLVFIIVILLCGFIAWFCRYEIIPGGANSAYRFDRWTGEMFWISGPRDYAVKNVPSKTKKTVKETTR